MTNIELIAFHLDKEKVEFVTADDGARSAPLESVEWSGGFRISGPDMRRIAYATDKQLPLPLSFTILLSAVADQWRHAVSNGFPGATSIERTISQAAGGDCQVLYSATYVVPLCASS